MTTIPTFIEGHQRVVDIFGDWPSFHDATVFKPIIDGATMEMTIHAFRMLDKTDEKGYFTCDLHHLIHFRFEGVSDIQFDQLTWANILFELGFELQTPSGFKVILESVMSNDGSDGTFFAERGTVVSVIPCDSRGKLLPLL